MFTFLFIYIVCVPNSVLRCIILLSSGTIHIYIVKGKETRRKKSPIWSGRSPPPKKNYATDLQSIRQSTYQFYHYFLSFYLSILFYIIDFASKIRQLRPWNILDIMALFKTSHWRQLPFSRNGLECLFTNFSKLHSRFRWVRGWLTYRSHVKCLMYAILMRLL